MPTTCVYTRIVHTHGRVVFCLSYSVSDRESGGGQLSGITNETVFVSIPKKNVELFDLNEYFARPGVGAMTAIAINMLSHVYTV